MTTTFDLERQLRVHFESSADGSVRQPQLAWVLEEVRRRRQRPGWLAGLRSPSMTADTIALTPVTRRRVLAPVLAAGLILLLLAAAFFAVGGRPLGSGPINGRIVYLVQDPNSGAKNVYTINPDGTGQQRLRNESYDCPTWSPDGKFISVTSAIMSGDGTGYRLLNTDVAGGDPVVGNVGYGCGVWTPDGQHLAVEGWSEADPSLNGIYTLRTSDGGAFTRLTTATPAPDHDIPIGYSPDGRMLAFIGPPGADGSNLFLVNADGSGRRRLGTLLIAGADWAPDGRSILVESSAHFYSVAVATGEATPVRIKAAPDEKIGQPRWSPDGTRILLDRTIEGSDDLWTMKADGTDLVRVTNEPPIDLQPDWGTFPIVK
jgi:Tol biopolymer transport system component